MSLFIYFFCICFREIRHRPSLVMDFRIVAIHELRTATVMLSEKIVILREELC